MGILKGEKKDLVIAVAPSFWPHFFAQPLIIKFVASAICFCLSSETKQGKGKKAVRRLDLSVTPETQFIVAYPEEGEQFVPDHALFDAFPLGEKGNPIRPRELMVSMSELRNMTGVRLVELEQGDRRIFCAVPTWEYEKKIAKADSSLVFITLEGLPPNEAFPQDHLIASQYLVLLGAYDDASQSRMSLVTLVKDVGANTNPPEAREKDEEAQPTTVAPKKQWLH